MELVKSKIAVQVLAGALLFSPLASFAFGPHGHEVSGEVADLLLEQHPKTQKKVRELLGQDVTLNDAAKWADCAKDAKVGADHKAHYHADPRYSKACKVFQTPEGEQAMMDFVARNWDNCKTFDQREPCDHQYHYTDVYIKHKEYRPGYVGAQSYDIVGAINAAIEVLKGNPSPKPFNIVGQKEALLLLAHYVGDIHQPLHVGSEYLSNEGKSVNPDEAKPYDPSTFTRGGNLLIVVKKNEDVQKPSNLHHEWDYVPSTVSASNLIGVAREVSKTPGDMKTWSTAWATETLNSASYAFQGLTFDPRAADGTWKARAAKWSDYNNAMRETQKLQLAKAGARLVQILIALWD